MHPSEEGNLIELNSKFPLISDCKNTPIPEDELSNVTVLLRSGPDGSAVIIEFVCNDGFDLLYAGDFVYECQEDGTWNNSNVPQCVNSWLFCVSNKNTARVLLFTVKILF